MPAIEVIAVVYSVAQPLFLPEMWLMHMSLHVSLLNSASKPIQIVIYLCMLYSHADIHRLGILVVEEEE